jgi:2-amino-4-hydroxy-6-hydroxymethyldihydropteridine diphosphokinase
MANRRFTLIPLVEIAPNFIHPVLGLKSTELLKACQDILEVEKISIN